MDCLPLIKNSKNNNLFLHDSITIYPMTNNSYIGMYLPMVLQISTQFQTRASKAQKLFINLFFK